MEVPLIDLALDDDAIVPLLRAACSDVFCPFPRCWLPQRGSRLPAAISCERSRRALLISMQTYICMHAVDALPLTAAAMRQVGFFYLVGHGVPEQDFDTLYADMTRFFALDSSVKSKVHTVTNPHNRGWTPLGEETLDPERQTCGDTKEGHYIGR